MKYQVFIILLFSVYGGTITFAQGKADTPGAVSFSQVEIHDQFWKPAMEKVALVTLPACILQTEVKTPRIRNFEKVARKAGEKHEGIFYDDSDVYKAIEAIAYSLKTYPDANLERKTDEWIGKIAKAQLEDGYLNTFYTLGNLNDRWSDMSMHEDYMLGHLIEAAVAYYHATGKRKLLDVSIRFADHFDSLFGPGKKHWVTGHQELELALVKLYRATNEIRYLKLAHWLLEERGHKFAQGYTWSVWKDTAYTQDAVPVRDQKEITGHAVRAMYLYSGAADVAALTGDEGYIYAMNRVWEDVVCRNLYVTGGIGSSGKNEGFSQDYDLPNETAYCETCASVGMVFWNHRMNQLTGDSKFIDILERSLYNSARDGLSLSGDRFFYGNPLASSGQHSRSEWFGTACCPSNIARLLASLGDYVYGVSEKGIWVNLYVGSQTKLKMEKGDVSVRQVTDYPWSGDIVLSIDPLVKSKFSLHLRIPGWVTDIPVPGGLYRFEGEAKEKFTLLLNGKPVPFFMDKGYAIVEREWRKGDEITLSLPMEVRRLVSKDEVKQDIGRTALQRGPLVYCVEGADNEGKTWNILLPRDTKFYSAFNIDILGGVVTVTFEGIVLKPGADGTSVKADRQAITAIPYYAWCNRGSNEMQVWLPEKINDIKIND